MSTWVIPQATTACADPATAPRPHLRATKATADTGAIADTGATVGIGATAEPGSSGLYRCYYGTAVTGDGLLHAQPQVLGGNNAASLLDAVFFSAGQRSQFLLASRGPLHADGGRTFGAHTQRNG